MTTSTIIDGLKVLIVDDEPDIMETLEELLARCDIDTARDYETAASMLSQKRYDMTIFDIMGVQGFDLLMIADKKKIPSLILTSHGLTPENLITSVKGGAYAYIPKDKMANIEDFIVDVIRAQKSGQKNQHHWLTKLAPYFERIFGKSWKKKDPIFWEQFQHTVQQARGETEKLF
jgi:DNA-binding NtrC family response regulator